MFDGNKDRDTPMYNMLNPPITARFVRICPVAWHSHISMRMEIYGCQGNVQSMGNAHGLLPSECSIVPVVIIQG